MVEKTDIVYTKNGKQFRKQTELNKCSVNITAQTWCIFYFILTEIDQIQKLHVEVYYLKYLENK